MTKNIAILIGSLRKESFSRKLANAILSLTPESLKLEIIEIGGISIYNQDHDDEGNPPSAWISFREKVKSFDGVLFITPEYNRSIPAVLKNALDVGSRPYGQSIWGGKPGAIISISQGVLGGFGANHHLRQCFVFLNILVMQQPEAYIGGIAQLFDSDGNIVNETSREFIIMFMNAFADWVERHPTKSI
jgi:chromate reductase